MNDPYGLLASGLPPEMAAQAMGITRQQMIAQALMAQANQPMENIGGVGAKLSPLQGLAKMAQTYAANRRFDDADKKYGDLASQRQKAVSDALVNYQTARDGQSMPEIPAPSEEEGGGPGRPAMATGGNPRAAIIAAMTNPLIANSPIVSADMKKMEPNWKVESSFDKSGREVKMLVDLNDPTKRMEFGASKTDTPVQVTTRGPDGQPVTRFVDPRAQTDPLAQPVKQEMVSAGGKSVAVNPYAPPASIQHTVTPDALLSRTTSLQVHGLGSDGLPTGDIKDVAKMIAEGRSAPLSSLAMSSPRGQMIMAEVARINPEYNVQDFHASDKAVKDFATGKQGNSVRSFNVAISHLGTLDQLSDALHNGDMKAVNAIGNAVATQTGGAAPTNFEAAKKIVADEIVKAIVGSGGAVQDREDAAATISKASSPAQLKGVIQTYTELMRGQLGGLRQQYEQSTRRKDFDRFLSADAAMAAHGSPSATDSGTRVVDW